MARLFPNPYPPNPYSVTFTKRLTVYVAALAIVLVGWILNVPQLYWMAGVLFLLPAISRGYAMWEHRGLVLEREVPRTGTLGDVIPVRFKLRNTTALPKLHLALMDDIAEGLAPEKAEALPLTLAPQGAEEVSYPARLTRRGPLKLSAIRVVSSDPLGLYRLEAQHPVMSEILVYPRVVSLPLDLLPTERGGGQAPLQSGSRRGESPSFYGIREYRPGDPLKHVHWRTAARSGRLAVVEWEAEESVDALLAVDSGPDGARLFASATLLDLSASLAASLAAEVLNAGDTVRVLLSGDDAGSGPTPVRGSDAISSVLGQLARAEAGAGPTLAQALLQRAPQLPPGMLACCLVGTPDPEIGVAVRTLISLRLQPVVYALLSVARMDPLPAEWSGLLAECEGAGARVVRLYQDDGLVSRLLS